MVSTWMITLLLAVESIKMTINQQLVSVQAVWYHVHNNSESYPIRSFNRTNYRNYSLGKMQTSHFKMNINSFGLACAYIGKPDSIRKANGKIKFYFVIFSLTNYALRYSM